MSNNYKDLGFMPVYDLAEEEKNLVAAVVFEAGANKDDNFKKRVASTVFNRLDTKSTEFNAQSGAVSDVVYKPGAYYEVNKDRFKKALSGKFDNELEQKAFEDSRRIVDGISSGELEKDPGKFWFNDGEIEKLKKSGKFNFNKVKQVGVQDEFKFFDYPDELQENKVIQEKLIEKGFNPGEVDGQIGPKTKEAIKKFQSENGLTVDGIAGPKTKGKLLSALNPFAATEANADTINEFEDLGFEPIDAGDYSDLGFEPEEQKKDVGVLGILGKNLMNAPRGMVDTIIRDAKALYAVNKGFEEGVSFGIGGDEQVQADNPIAYFAGQAAGGITSLVGTGALFGAGAVGAGAAELANAARAVRGLGQFAPRFLPRMIVSGATFGTHTAISETVAQIKEGRADPIDLGGKVLKDTAMGGALGFVGGVASMPMAALMGGGIGYGSAKMDGADEPEALLSGAMFMGFEIFGSIGRDKQLRVQALKVTKRTLADYAQKKNPKMPRGEAELIAEKFMNQKAAGVGGWDKVLETPENGIRYLEKLNANILKRTSQLKPDAKTTAEAPKLLTFQDIVENPKTAMTPEAPISPEPMVESAISPEPIAQAAVSPERAAEIERAKNIMPLLQTIPGGLLGEPGQANRERAPDWSFGWPFLQKKGYTEEGLTLIFQKVLDGKPLAPVQQQVYNSIVKAYEEDFVSGVNDINEADDAVITLRQMNPEITDQEINDIISEIDKEELWDEERTTRAVEKYLAEKKNRAGSPEASGSQRGDGQADASQAESKITPSGQIRPELQAPIPKELFQEKGEMFEGVEEVPAKYGKSPTFYSKLEKTITDKMPNAAGAGQIMGILNSAGVKKGEIDWLDIEGFLKDKPKVTKQELLDYIRQNQVELKEVTKADRVEATKAETELRQARMEFEDKISALLDTPKEITAWQKYDHGGKEILAAKYPEEIKNYEDLVKREAAETEKSLEILRGGLPKFSQWQLPGGDNYRELLLTLPVKDGALPEKPKPLTELPSGFNLVLDRNGNDKAYPWGKWGVVPEGQQHGRGYTGRYYEAKEEAIKATIDQLNSEQLSKYNDEINRLRSGKDFRSGHFDEPNILAHVRMNDRTDVDGKKVLFLEEVQSDWHQKGRKEGYIEKKEMYALKVKTAPYDAGVGNVLRGNYSTEQEALSAKNRLENDPEVTATYEIVKAPATVGTIPNAPFKKTWHELSMKRMLRYAAENGYDKLAWTTGEQQAERYDLSKQISKVNYERNENGTGKLIANDLNNKQVINVSIPDAKVEDYIGKDVAKKLLESKPIETGKHHTIHELSGLDLKVGGEGMKGFYDQMLPSFLNNYAKKWGARVGETNILVDKKTDNKERDAFFSEIAGTKMESKDIYNKVHSIDITPSMQKSVILEGQPIFEGKQAYKRKSDYEYPTVQDAGGNAGMPGRSGTASGVQSPISVKFKETGKVVFPAGKIKTPEDVAFAFRSLTNEAQENFLILAVKDGVQVAVEHITTGTHNFATPAVYEVFNLLDAAQADSIYLVHNHPSGRMEASPEDRRFTRKAKQILEKAGIKMRGHVIIDTEKFVFINEFDEVEVLSHKEYAKTKKVPQLKKYFEWSKSKDDFGPKIRESKDVYEITKGLQQSQGMATVIIANQDMKVLSVNPIPAEQINSGALAKMATRSRGNIVFIAGQSLNLRDASSLKEELELANIALYDMIQVSPDNPNIYKSAADTGVMEPGVVSEGGVVAEPGLDPKDIEKYRKGVEDLLKAKKAQAAKPKGSAGASVGAFQESLVTGTKNPEAKVREIMPIELVRLARNLMGDVPLVRKMPSSRGLFSGSKLGSTIKIHPDLFKRGQEKQLAATLAHEIGHLIDFLPEETMNRGNLLGRIASLVNYLKGTLPRKALQSLDTILTPKDRAMAKKAAEAAVGPKPGKDKKEELTAWKKAVSEKYSKAIADQINEKGLISEKELRSQMIALSFEWRPLDGGDDSYMKYRSSSTEIYADNISALFNNPEYVKTKAPLFYEMFFEYLDKKPEVKREYTAAVMMMNGSSEGLAEQRLEDRRLMFAKGEEIRKRIEEEAEKRKGDLYALLRQSFENVHYPLLKKLQKGNTSILPRGEAAYFLEEMDMWQNDAYLLTHRIDNEVLKALRETDATQEDLSDLLYLQRVVGRDVIGQESQPILDEANQELLESLEGQGYNTADEISDREDLANPLGYNPQTAREAIEDLKTRISPEGFAALEKASAKYRDIVHEVTKLAVDAGVYSQEVYDKILEPNKDTYVSFGVLDYISPNVAAGIKKQKGTLKDIESPLITTTLKTVSLLRLIARNNAARSALTELEAMFPQDVADSKRKVIGGKTAGFIKPGWSPAGPRGSVTYMVDGKVVSKDVDIYIAESFKSDPHWMTDLGAALGKALLNKQFKGLVITYNAGFQYMNLIRDFKRAYINLNAMGHKITVGGLIKRYWQALDAAKKRASGITDAEISEMLTNKAMDVPFNDYQFDERNDGFARIMRQFKSLGNLPISGGLRENIIYFLTQVDGAVRYVGNVIETIPKVAGYRYLREKGLDARKAAYETRNYIGTPNYRVKGKMTKISNELFLFSNIAIQGMKADMRLAVKPSTRAGYWWANFKANHVWKLLMIGAAAGLFGDEPEKFYEKVSEYDKTNYIIIPLGYDDDGRAVYWRVPHDEFSRMQAAMLWKVGTGTKNGIKAISQVFDVGADYVPGLAPGIKIGADWASFLSGKNPYDDFRSRNVVSDTAWEAGGLPRLKGMLKHTFNSAGFSQFTAYDDRRDSTVEAVIKGTPVVSAMTRIIKVSDYGLVEKARELVEEENKISAQRQIKRQQIFDKYFKGYRASDIARMVDADGNIKARQKVSDDIIKATQELYGKDFTKLNRTTTEKAFFRYALRKMNDPWVTGVLSSSSNAQKIKVLSEAKASLSEAGYDDLVKTLLDARLISKAVVAGSKEGDL